MKVKFNINAYNIFLYLLFIVTSYQALLKISFLDDLLMVLLIILMIKKSIHKIMKVKITFLSFAFLLCFLNAVFGCILFNTVAMTSFFQLMKLSSVLLLAFVVPNDDSNKKTILHNFFLISIPNIVYALYQFYYCYIQHVYLPGKYELGKGYRLDAFTSHPIYFALMLLCIIVYFLYLKKGMIRFLVIFILSWEVYYTWTSMANIFLILIFLSFFLNKITEKKSYMFGFDKKSIYIVVSIFLFVSTCYLYYKTFSEPDTIRCASVKYVLTNLNPINLLIGNFTGAYIYNGLSEAYWFHILFDLGIIGLYVFFCILKNIFVRNVNDRNICAILILMMFVLSSAINEGYLLPFIFFIPIYCSTIKKANGAR